MSFYAQFLESQKKRRMQNRFPRQKKPIEKVNPRHQHDIMQQTCNRMVGCGKPIKGFKDALSKKEYGISGLCQKCQDELFGE